jgi:hypothetical protein
MLANRPEDMPAAVAAGLAVDSPAIGIGAPRDRPAPEDFGYLSESSWRRSSVLSRRTTSAIEASWAHLRQSSATLLTRSEWK